MNMGFGGGLCNEDVLELDSGSAYTALRAY